MDQKRSDTAVAVSRQPSAPSRSGRLHQSGVCLSYRHLNLAARVIDLNQPWGAADGAIFDIRLTRPAAWIYADLNFFAAVWTHDDGFHVSDTVPEWKVFVEGQVLFVFHSVTVCVPSVGTSFAKSGN